MKIDRSAYDAKRQELLDTLQRSEESFESMLKDAGPFLKLMEEVPAGTIHLSIVARHFMPASNFAIDKVSLGASASGMQAQLEISNSNGTRAKS